MSWRLGGIEQRLICPHVSDVVHAQMWVLEQVADLVIDLERPAIVKEIGIKPFHSHPNVVLQLTTDDYGSCLLVVPCDASALRQRQMSALIPFHRCGPVMRCGANDAPVMVKRDEPWFGSRGDVLGGEQRKPFAGWCSRC